MKTERKYYARSRLLLRTPKQFDSRRQLCKRSTYIANTHAINYTTTSPIWFTIIISNIICLLSNNKDHICAIISYTCYTFSSFKRKLRRGSKTNARGTTLQYKCKIKFSAYYYSRFPQSKLDDAV